MRVCDACVEQLKGDYTVEDAITHADESGWGTLLEKYKDGVVTEDELYQHFPQSIHPSARKALWNAAVTKKLGLTRVSYQVCILTHPQSNYPPFVVVS